MTSSKAIHLSLKPLLRVCISPHPHQLGSDTCHNCRVPHWGAANRHQTAPPAVSCQSGGGGGGGGWTIQPGRLAAVTKTRHPRGPLPARRRIDRRSRRDGAASPGPTPPGRRDHYTLYSDPGYMSRQIRKFRTNLSV